VILEAACEKSARMRKMFMMAPMEVSFSVIIYKGQVQQPFAVAWHRKMMEQELPQGCLR
jgi:hypothetical protein